MLSYLIIFFGLLFFTILCNNKGQDKAALYTLGFTLLFVYMALDIHRIHDVSNYEKSFYFYKDFSISNIKGIITSTELGYIALNILVAKIYPSFKLFYFIYAIVVVTSYLSFIRRYSNNIWLSGVILICMFFFPLFIMRQYFAISICLLSIPLILKRKPVPFALCMLLAFLFHRSSLVFSLCYFLPLLQVNKRNITIVTIIGVVIIVFMSVFDNFFAEIIMGSSYAYHYGAYIEEEGSANSWKSAAIAIADLAFVLYCYRGKLKYLNQEQSFFFFMCVVYTLFSILGVMGSVFQAFYRILPYFNLSIIILLPDAANYIKNRNIRTISLTAIIGFYVFSLINVSKSWVFFTF